jgi:TRAP-type C4-dicarboxylate transport system permease small subunit
MAAVVNVLILVLKSLVALLLLFMAVLTGADVVGRYGFNRPVLGTDEMIAASMALLIFGALPLVTLQHGQISVDIGANMFHGAAKRMQHLVVSLLSAVIMAFMALQLWALAGKTILNSDHSSMLHIPFGPLVYVMAVMSALTAFITLCLAVFPPPPPPARTE